MSKLTVQDIINTVGRNTINDLFNQTGNRYLNERVDKYIQEKLSVAHFLGLQNTSGKKLIDIGTGAGWFPYICKLYGHECIGTETIHTDVFKKSYIPIYKHFDINVTDDLVYANTPFSINKKVDYIVTLRSFFPNRPNVWELENWTYFFNDIKKNINEHGGIYIGSNSGSRRGKYRDLPDNQKSHWGPAEVGNIFKSYIVPADKQKRIKPNTIYIPYKDVVKLGETQ